MATSKIQVTEGSGKNLATNSFTEDAVTKELSRVVQNDSSGNEIALTTSAQTGSVTETAPATDTASSGLNGRLQRIAQRITSLIAALGSPFQAGGSIGNTSFDATQATASNLNAQVVGSVSAGSADSGKPVKVGAKYNASNPTYADGDRGDLQIDQNGKLKVKIDDAVQVYFNDNSGTGSLGSLNSTTSQDVAGRGSASVNISGTWVGTVTFQGSNDGSTFFTITGIDQSDQSFDQTTTANGTWTFNVAGLTKLQIKMTAYTSGTASVAVRVGGAAAGGVVRVAGGFAEVANLSAGSLNADLVPSTDVSTYRSVSLQISGTYSGTITFQGSNDNSTFASIQLLSTTGVTTSTGSTGLFYGAITYRYFRVRMTSYSSGTATGVVEFYTNPISHALVLQTTTSVTPGTAAANLGKAEDAAHASGDTGVFALSVRNDNAATTYAADQDYQPIATDKNARVIITRKAPTATLANVAGSASSVTLIAANADRLGATIFNDSTSALYVKFGSTASATSFVVKMQANDYYEIPNGYTGIITGIWDTATGNARTTELT